MAIPLSNEIRALLDRPNFAHLATLMPDGSPQSVPIWVGREGDRILICTGEGSLKAKNTRRDPCVALSIVDFTTHIRRLSFLGAWLSGVPIQVHGSHFAQVHRQAVPVPQPRRESCGGSRHRENPDTRSFRFKHAT